MFERSCILWETFEVTSWKKNIFQVLKTFQLSLSATIQPHSTAANTIFCNICGGERFEIPWNKIISICWQPVHVYYNVGPKNFPPNLAQRGKKSCYTPAISVIVLSKSTQPNILQFENLITRRLTFLNYNKPTRFRDFKTVKWSAKQILTSFLEIYSRSIF